jgi:hypothetical protein
VLLSVTSFSEILMYVYSTSKITFCFNVSARFKTGGSNIPTNIDLDIFNHLEDILPVKYILPVLTFAFGTL